MHSGEQCIALSAEPKVPRKGMGCVEWQEEGTPEVTVLYLCFLTFLKSLCFS